MALTPNRSRNRRLAFHAAPHPARGGGGDGASPLPRASPCSTTASSASSTTWATTRPSCRRRGCPTGRHETRAERRGADPLPHAALALDPLRDVRDQAAREAPVFVARQWIRHRTANVNEYSARYSILDREFYIPEPGALAAQSTVNNQGRGEVLEGEEARAGARPPQVRRGARLRPLPGDAEPGRSEGAGAGARADEPARERLHPVVLEDGPATTSSTSCGSGPTPTRSTRSGSMPKASQRS